MRLIGRRPENLYERAVRAATESAEGARKELRRGTRRARKNVARGAGRLEELLDDTYAGAVGYVKMNPTKTALIALGLGLIAASLCRVSARHHENDQGRGLWERLTA